MNRRILFFGLVLATFYLLTTCDTSDSVKPRNDQFFIKYFGQDGDQYAADLVATSDGGYVIVGTSDPNKSLAAGGDPLGDGDEDIIIVKTDSEGNEEWVQVYDGGNLGRDEGTAIIETTTGFVVVGNTFNSGGADWDVVVIELLADGSINGSPYHFNEMKNGMRTQEFAKSITIVDNGSFYMIAGNTTAAKEENNQPDPQDYYVLKLDLLFVEDSVWKVNNKIEGKAEAEFGVRIFQNGTDNYVVFGTSIDPNDQNNLTGLDTYSMFEYKGTTTGTNKYYGDLNSQFCNDVYQAGTNYLMIGTQAGSPNQLYYASVNSDYSAGFETTIFPSLDLEGNSIVRSIDNENIYLGSITYTSGDKDIFLGKTSIDGAIERWSRTFGSDGLDNGAKLLQNPDGSIVFTGTMNISGQRKICLIKTNAEGELKL